MANEVVVNLDDLRNKIKDDLSLFISFGNKILQCLDGNDIEQIGPLFDECLAICEKCKFLYLVLKYLSSLEKVSQDNQNN